MNLSLKVMLGEIPKLWLVVATLSLGWVRSAQVCERGTSWWNRRSGVCVPCTRCDPGRLAVRYPCEVHRDTVCQPLSEVHIWPFNTPQRTKDNAPSEVSDYEYYENVDYDSRTEKNESEVKWDLQTLNLTLAASGCVIFFVVVLSLSLYHTKQWKILKQALKSDVQDLTAKLRLMEASSETIPEPVSTNHHLYCNIHVGKEALLGQTSAKMELGNVYTQEKHQP